MHIAHYLLLVGAFVTLGATARGEDEPDALLGAKLLLVKRTSMGTVVKVGIKGNVPMPSAANDPTLAGAALSVFDTAPSATVPITFSLPAAGWKGLGVPAGSKGFRYKGDIGDPCRTVLLRPTTIKALCKRDRPLDMPFRGEVGVVLTVGEASKRYCASFGGSVVRNTGLLTKRKDAPVPATCPAPALGERFCIDAATQLRGFPASVSSAIGFGAIAISCGSIGPDGVAACSCESFPFVRSITVPAIGNICISRAGPCSDGKIDCDGGGPFDIDLVADHDIGACSGNAACAAACDAACNGMGANYEVRSSACEGFCRGGSNDDSACTEDSQCPDGECVGPVLHPGRCNCQCGGSALGAPSAPGSLTCRLGVRVTLQSLADDSCLGFPVADTGPLCLPLTTATSSAVLINADGVSGATIPAGGGDTSQGAPVSCANFQAGNLSGLTLVGAFAEFDAVGGDSLGRSELECQF